MAVFSGIFNCLGSCMQPGTIASSRVSTAVHAVVAHLRYWCVAQVFYDELPCSFCGALFADRYSHHPYCQQSPPFQQLQSTQKSRGVCCKLQCRQVGCRQVRLQREKFATGVGFKGCFLASFLSYFGPLRPGFGHS